jgi:hypothetical protein
MARRAAAALRAVLETSLPAGKLWPWLLRLRMACRSAVSGPIADVAPQASYRRMTWTKPEAWAGRFIDAAFSAEQRCALGVDQITGARYLSIPVSNRAVDYEEHYRLTPEEYEAYLADPALALAFADRCRSQEADDRLIVPPGDDRGIAR